MKIAFLGPEGSYSHLAAKAFLSSEKEKQSSYGWDECIPFRNFTEVLAAVENGKVDAAALPIENSLQGGVSQNLDLLQTADNMYAMKEYVLRIEHHLIYKEGVRLSEIKETSCLPCLTAQLCGQNYRFVSKFPGSF